MAKESKTKRYKVIPNEELLRVGKGFVPVFGSDEDLHIINRCMALDKKLPLVDNKILRGDPKNHTSKMKDILRKEEALIHAITKRNMDF